MNRFRFSLRQFLFATFCVALMLAVIGAGVRHFGTVFVANVASFLFAIVLAATVGFVFADVLFPKSNPKKSTAR
jgi:hypothetical protein